MVNIIYSLAGANGDVIVFDDESYILETGMSGFGVAPTAVRIEDSAGNGGVWRHTKRTTRDVDLPITVLGDDRVQVQERLRRLTRLTQDTSGPTRLIASYSDGVELALEMHYTGGAEGQWGSEENLTYARWVMSFKAPQPFWTSTSSESFSINSGNSGRGLLPQLTKLKVSSSNSLGTIVISNSADVDSYPIWTIEGPITNFKASNGTQSFTLEGEIPAGVTYTVDTEKGTVTNSSGANAYSLLGPAPKFFVIPAGFTSIEVTGEGTDSNTVIRCDYALRYEVVH